VRELARYLSDLLYVVFGITYNNLVGRCVFDFEEELSFTGCGT
jgi:hypothetical protein